MRFSQITLGGFVTSAAATNLWVSSYGGNITSVQLSQSPNGTYSLKQTSFNDESSDPSWLTKDQYNDIVYCVDEGFDSPNGTISSYKTSPSGELTLIDRHITISGPVASVPYNGGKALVVAHYSGSGVSSWTINANGSLTPMQSFLFTLAKLGPNPARQEAPHPHEVILDPTDSYVAVPDLGADLVRIFHIDPQTSLLTAQTPISVPPGSGPRHGTFLKTDSGATYFYLISELANTVASYNVSYTPTGLNFSTIAISGTYGNQTTPAGAASAEAILSPDHKFLLTSARNATLFSLKNFDPNNSTKIPSDTLQTWAIDDTTGKLTFKQLSPSGGFYPRQFSVNKNGTMAAVGLQEDARVVIVSRNTTTGLYGGFLASINLPGEITSVIWDE
ncbi:YkgB protein [Mollisia scopiformis]|uniref:YkgB protein n=1 Tax=Mollisia scopiformis TaxID=149040 RepID=A0A194X7L0_MOLSC|nr:YkgB protein [Mollisia scopiformis]KUJ16153.1 YkgB protein [Mollisia scopiformis]